jgi:hypothetical protein
MTALVDRALALNPSFALGWLFSGQIRRWAGELDTAVAHGETALRLNPRGHIHWPLYLIGSALASSRRFEEAIPKPGRAGTKQVNSGTLNPRPYGQFWMIRRSTSAQIFPRTAGAEETNPVDSAIFGVVIIPPRGFDRHQILLTTHHESVHKRLMWVRGRLQSHRLWARNCDDLGPERR